MTARARWLWISGVTVCAVIASASILLALALREIARHPFRENELSQRITTALLTSKGVSLSRIVPASAYCIVGAGQDPHQFVRKEFPKAMPVGPQEANDPFFLRSDSHWHLIVFQENEQRYAVAPIAVAQINLADEDYRARCASDFVVSAYQRVRFHQDEWVLETK